MQLPSSVPFSDPSLMKPPLFVPRKTLKGALLSGDVSQGKMVLIL